MRQLEELLLKIVQLLGLFDQTIAQDRAFSVKVEEAKVPAGIKERSRFRAIAVLELGERYGCQGGGGEIVRKRWIEVMRRFGRHVDGCDALANGGLKMFLRRQLLLL